MTGNHTTESATAGKTATVIRYAVLFTVVITAGAFVENPYYLQVMTFIGLNVILALGLNLLMGYAGQISLGHAAFYGIGAYGTGILTANYGISPWAALILAVLLAVIIAYLVGVPTLKLSGYYLGMGTLGFGMIVHILIREWASVTGGASGLVGIPSLSLGAISFESARNYYLLVWFTVLAVIEICRRIVCSRMGRALRSIHDSENASRAVGVNTSDLKLKVFVLSAALAALAGFFYAHFVSFISPETFGFIASVRMVTMVVIGGMASIWGALFGAVLLTVLPEVLHSFADFEMVVYGMILITVMIFMPQGLTRGVIDIYERSKKGKPQ